MTPAQVRDPVLALLLGAGLVAALALGFVSVAPNRLLGGRGVALAGLLHGGWLALLAPAALLLAAPWLPPRRPALAAVALAAAALLAGLSALAGAEAARVLAADTAALARAGAGGPDGPGPSLVRVSLGGGFWVLALLLGLAVAQALQRLAALQPGGRARLLASAATTALLAGPLLALLALGRLDALSLLQEYANRSEAFHDAGLRHLQIVAAALLPALLLGLPLGWLAARRSGFGRALFALLSLVQTLPSIALFGLLIAPLAWLGARLPGAGIAGTGLLPAAIALTLYALLPLVHAVAAGLRGVPAALRDAGLGMGLGRAQLFWQLELPLAAPVLLAGLRVTTVQLVGLAVVAALIGAGGYGSLVFQGLLGSALDLVLLGVLPVLGLALAAEAGFGALELLLAGALHQPAGLHSPAGLPAGAGLRADLTVQPR